MVPLVSFVDDDNLQYINLGAKVHDFINHDSKEWNINPGLTILPISALSDIKTIQTPYSPIEDKILWCLSQDEKFTLKSTTWVMRKPLVHPMHKILNLIWKLNLLLKMQIFLFEY